MPRYRVSARILAARSMTAGLAGLATGAGGAFETLRWDTVVPLRAGAWLVKLKDATGGRAFEASRALAAVRAAIENVERRKPPEDRAAPPGD